MNINLQITSIFASIITKTFVSCCYCCRRTIIAIAPATDPTVKWQGNDWRDENAPLVVAGAAVVSGSCAKAIVVKSQTDTNNLNNKDWEIISIFFQYILRLELGGIENWLLFTNWQRRYMTNLLGKAQRHNGFVNTITHWQQLLKITAMQNKLVTEICS